MLVIAVSLDNYKGYNYTIPDRIGKHSGAYVGVVKSGERVARIMLKKGEIEFYANTPKEVVNDKATLETWIKRNMVEAKNKWNVAHPRFKV
jgi:hypothetical protein